MASSSETENGNGIFDCPICFKRLTDPRYLPCFHTFCESCLNKCISSRGLIQGTHLPVFKCPVCKLAVKAPDPRSSTENWASLLPFNHIICSLMEFAQDDSNNLDIHCSPCKRGGELVKSLFWCHECSDALCESCHVHHKRMRLSASHKTDPIDDVSTANVETDSFQKQCLDHSDTGAILNSYCLDHNESCCEICLTTKHSRCQNLCRLQDLTMKVKNETFVQDVLKQITDVNSEVHLILNDKQKTIDQLENKHQQIQDQISDFITKAKDHLDKLHEDLKHNFESLHEKRKEKLVGQMKKIESFQNTVTYDQRVISSLVEVKPCLPTYATIERIKTQLLSNMGRLKSDFGEDENFEYELQIDEIFGKFMTDITSVGIITVNNHSRLDTFASVEKAVKAFNSTENDSVIEVPTFKSGRNGYRKSYIAAIEEVRLMDDVEDKILPPLSETESITKAPRKIKFNIQNSWVQSGAFFGEDILIFPDYYYEKIVFYDIKGSFIYEQYLYKKPWHVTTNLKGQVFVSFPDSRCVIKYKFKKGILFTSKTINTKVKVEYFDVLGDHIVFVHPENALVIINKKGKILESLPIKCSQFASSKKEEKLYYNVENCVKCYSLRESNSFSYVCPSEPRKLHVNQLGNIYAIFGQFNLHVISYDGILLQNIEIKTSKTIEFISFDFEGEWCLLGALRGTRCDPRKINPERFWEGDASFMEYSEVTIKLQVELFKLHEAQLETKL